MDFSNYTDNADFNKNGWLHIPNLVDVEQFKEEMPEKKGSYVWGRYMEDDSTNPDPNEDDDGVVSRTCEEKYGPLVMALKDPIKQILGREVKHTYWFDRWYVPGQNLHRHKDWPCCEISVTLHLEDNASEPWPIGIRTHAGHEYLANLKPGDALLYNGTYREHWRPYLPYEYNEDGTEKNISYHQIFMHYVMVDGEWGHLGFDEIPEPGTPHQTGPSGRSLPYNITDQKDMNNRALLDEIMYTKSGGKRWYKHRYKNNQYHGIF